MLLTGYGRGKWQGILRRGMTDTVQIWEGLEKFKEDIALYSDGIYNGELLKLLDKKGMPALRQKRLSWVARAARALEGS